MVAPTTAPQSVYTPVLLQPTEQVQKEVTGGSLPGNPTVTMVVSNGPSAVRVTKSATSLAKKAVNAPVVTDQTPELAATGDERSSKVAFTRHQKTMQRSWPQGSAVAKLSWTGQGPTSETDELFISYGTSNASLAQGPGWYDGTAPPGAGGNIAIAGHRTGFGAPFGDLDRMSAGDALVLETPQGQTRTYEVSTIMVVEPSATWVLGPNVLRDGSDTLTLTTCDPPGVNTRRLVVVARDVTG